MALDSCPAQVVRRDTPGGQHTADFHRCSRPKSCFTAKRGVDLQRCQPESGVECVASVKHAAEQVSGTNLTERASHSFTHVQGQRLRQAV